MVAEIYLEVREVSLNRLKRESDVSSFILEKVAKMKTQSSTTVGSEKEDVRRKHPSNTKYCHRTTNRAARANESCLSPPTARDDSYLPSQ